MTADQIVVTAGGVPAGQWPKSDGRRVRWLDLSEEQSDCTCPVGWERLPVDQFFDADLFREDLMQFLEDWPSRPLKGENCFDDLFRLRGGYSVWWCGPGAYRSPMRGAIPALRSLWILDRVLKSVSPASVVVSSRDAVLASCVRSRCDSANVPCSWLEETDKKPALSNNAESLPTDVARALWKPLRLWAQSVLGRWRSRWFRGRYREDKKPCVLFASRAFRYVELDSNGLRPLIWSGPSKGLRALCPDVAQRFLLRKGEGAVEGEREPRRFESLVRKTNSPVVVAEWHRGVSAYLRSLPREVAAIWRYHRLMGTATFRSSFRFAGADVYEMYRHSLHRSICSIAEWSQQVADAGRAIQSAGNVVALLVGEEFYRPAMAELAAARELGIPTVGVQHGTIMPAHYVYTVPRGHIEGAPIPDYFAAYGSYAKSVVSDLGAYPRERVWVTGPSRLDDLVNNPISKSDCRAALSLPEESVIVLVTTQTYHWFSTAVRVVLESVRNQANCVVCVKTHPSPNAASIASLEAMASEVGISQVRFFTDRFDELLAACDILISASSTTVLEAILRAKRTICVNFSQEPDRYPYATEGPALPARSPEQLREAVDIALSTVPTGCDAIREQFLRDHAGPARLGKATLALVSRLRGLWDREGECDERDALGGGSGEESQAIEPAGESVERVVCRIP